MSNAKKVTVGSGNVFADLGFANPEEELLKAKLIREIRSIIKRRKLTQAKAAVILGLRQPDVSALATGRVGKFLNRPFGSLPGSAGLQSRRRCTPQAAPDFFTCGRRLRRFLRQTNSPSRHPPSPAPQAAARRR